MSGDREIPPAVLAHIDQRLAAALGDIEETLQSCRDELAKGVSESVIFASLIQNAYRLAGGGRIDTVMGTMAGAIILLLRADPSAITADELERAAAWSRDTFGPGPRTAGVLDHIRKELAEVEAAPADVTEWIDLVLLALDGALRAGHSGAAILEAYHAKRALNRSRTWPDWRTADRDKGIEHIRGESS